MIGCSLNRCSLLHVAEAIIRVPYLGKALFPGRDRILTLVDEAGHEQVFGPRDIPGCSFAFTRVQEVMDQRGLICHAHLGTAPCLVFSGAAALDTALAMLRANPGALLCDRAECPVCPVARGYL
jgi:aminoglycoside N3'-acetyltransferase